MAILTLVASLFLFSLHSAAVHCLSTTCVPRDEMLFVNDPTDRQAFLSCKAYATNPLFGFWERHFCPNDMHFEYNTQQCMANLLPPNMVQEANDLLQIAILNGSCARGEQCIGGTLCDPVRQRCLCPYGSVAVLETLSCAKLTPLMTTQQQQQLSHNQHYWRPQCPANSHHLLNGQCLPLMLNNGKPSVRDGGGQQQSAKEFMGSQGNGFFKVPIGEQCNDYSGHFCADQNALCINGRCQCIPPMVEQKGHCQVPSKQQEAGPGELCSGGHVCVRGSVCSQHIPVCVCPPDTELLRGWCVKNPPIASPTTTGPGQKQQQRHKEAKVGEKCSLNADCATGAYCNGNSQPPTCQCLSTHVNVDEQCEKVVYPGQRGCELDLQCSAGYAGARCLNGQCACPPGSTAVDQTCIPGTFPACPIAWPGEACNISRLMPICSADSYCFEGRCVCHPPLRLFQKQCIRRSDAIRKAEEEGQEENEISRERRKCARHGHCPRGWHCSGEKGRCIRCREAETRLGANCVHLDEFGGKFGADSFHDNEGQQRADEEENGQKKPAFLDDVDISKGANGNGSGATKRMMMGPSSRMETNNNKLLSVNGVPVDRSGRRSAPAGSGVDQIFAAISALLRKASAADGLLMGNLTSSKTAEGHRQRRQSAAKAERKKAHSGRQLHRLEGEPCVPGDICQLGTQCEEGHCKCPAGRHCPATTTTTKNTAASFRPIGANCSSSHHNTTSGSGGHRCSGGSVCLNSSCVCTDGSSPDVRKLLCRQPPGGRCSAGQHCSGQSECRLGLCHCRPGLRLFVHSRRLPKCVQAVAWPGQSCRSGEKCVGSSECSFGQICMCPPDHSVTTNGTECTRSRGEQQQMREEKLFGVASDDPSPAVGTSSSRPGQSCANGQTCIGASLCRHGVCVCARGKHLHEGSHSCVDEEEEEEGTAALQALDHLLLGSSGPGQLCVPGGGAECGGGSRCEHGICTCPEDHTLFRGKCQPPTARLSGPDKFRAQSLLFSPDFAAMDSPPSDSTPKEDSSALLDPLPSRQVAPGAMCRLSLECPYRTECLRGVCRCKKGETLVNGICRKTIHEVLPGGRCDTQKGFDCVGESHCFYGICVCLYGLVIVGQECANADVLKAVPPGGDCVQGQHCEGRARCVRGKCQCPRGHRLQSRRCVARSAPAISKEPAVVAHAETAAETPMPMAASLIPLMNVHQMPKFIYTIPAALAAATEEGNGGGKFSQILTANQMSINLLDQQLLRSLLGAPFGLQQPGPAGCEGPGCPPATGPPPNESADLLASPEQALPGHPCSAGQLCRGGAICLGGLCVCRPGFRPLGGLCQIARVGLGQPCFINEQCHGSHGFCIDGICRCNSQQQQHSGSVASSAFHRHRCPVRPVAATGEDCSRAQSCGWNSVCGQLSRVCECASGLESSQGACVAARRPRGTECLSSSNCHKFGFCDNGYCVCKAGHQSVGDFCLPPPQPVVDDPKAYVDPDLMAALLKKRRIGDIPSGLHSEGKMPNNSPFGVRLARLGTGRPAANGQQRTWETDDDMGGNNVQRLFGGVEEEQEETADEEKTRGSDWPGSAQSDDHQQQGLLQFAPARIVANFSPAVRGQHRGPFLTKGARTLRVETRRRKVHGHRGIAMPGEFCGNRERICLGNSVCLTGWCQCPEGVRLERGMCALDDPSVLAASTPPPASGASHSPMKQRREPHLPFQSCANGPCIHGAVCIRSAALPAVQKLGSFCQCASGSIFLDSRCVPRKPEMRILPIGSHCPQPAICDFGSVCGPKNICQCPEGLKPVAGICVQIALPGESCSHGEFCADGAVCAPGLDACVCPVGWKVRQGKCHRERKKMARLVQQKRKRDRNAGNKVGRRQSNISGAIPSSMPSPPPPPGPPHVLVPLGETCQSSADCQAVSHAFCPVESRRCSCLPGFVQLYSSVCVSEHRMKLPGEECVASAHFCSGNSWCKEGRCQCFQPDSVVSVDGLCQQQRGVAGQINANRRRHSPSADTRPARGEEESAAACTSADQCPQGAECRQGECLCNGLSLAQTLLAGSTTSRRQCALDLDCPPVLRCLQSRCVCIPVPSEADEPEPMPEWNYAVGEPVVAPILPGTFCDAFSGCAEGATCLRGRCRCNSQGHHLAFVNGTTKCVAAAEDGTNKWLPGDEELQKQLFGSENMEQFGMTLGAKAWKENANLGTVGQRQIARREVRPLLTEHKDRPKLLPGQNCSSQSQLCSGGSICLSGLCACPKGTAPDGKGKCRAEKVSSAMLPQKGTFASEPNLSALPAQQPVQEQPTTPMSQKLVLPGSQCGPLDICTGRAACVEGICLCPAGTRPSPRIGECETLEQQMRQGRSEMTSSSPTTDEAEMGSTHPAPINTTNRMPSTSKPTTMATAINSLELLPQGLTAKNGNAPPAEKNAASVPIGLQANNSSLACLEETDCTPPPNEVPFPVRKLTNVKGPRRAPSHRPYARPSESCANQQICTGGSICQRSSELCECPPQKPVLRNHICFATSGKERRQTSPRSVPDQRSGATELLPPVQLAENDQEDEGSERSSAGEQPPRPRISGPPLRKTSSSASSGTATSGTGPGVCPPGNKPTTDSSGQILICNGMTPNCPPKSYCFVTGEASETYNCCKAY